MIKGLKFFQRLIPSDIRRANGMVSTALKNGYQKGSIFAQSNNITGAKKVYVKSKSAVKELKAVKFKKEDAPAVAAAIASIVPIPLPGLGFFVYGAGHAIQYGVKCINKLCKFN